MLSMRFIFIYLSFVCLFPQGKVSAAELNYITESFPPYNFKEDNKITGISVEILEEMLKRMNVKKNRNNFKVLPWSRGYRMAQDSKLKNVIFAISKNEIRKNLFKWVGPFAYATVSVFIKKGQHKISNFADLLDLKGVAVRDDIGEQTVVAKGFPEKNLLKVSSSDQLFKALRLGRANFFVYGEEVSFYTIKKKGFDINEFERVLVLDRFPQYFGFNKSVADEIVEQYQVALNAVKADIKFIKRIETAYNIKLND